MSRRCIYSGMLLVIIFVLIGLAAANPIQAAEAEDWHSFWQIKADFVGNQPNVKLIVTVEKYVDGNWLFYAEEVQMLICTTSPAVTLVDDTAVFNGSGSIRCAMPSVQALVQEMTDGAFTPNESCNCKGDPMIKADVTLDGNTTAVEWENPLVYRTVNQETDMALAAPVPAFSTLPDASLLFQVDGHTAQSNPFIANEVPNTLSAAYLSLYDALFPAFLANGEDPGTAAGAVDTLSVSYAAARLYIGASPVTNAALHGTLFSLEVDPGCYGTG